MNANELRIGNWVEFTGEWSYRKYEKGALFQWDASDWYALGECTMSLDDLAPIPITEEVLLKCGSEVYEFDNGQPNQYRLGERLFVIREGIITDYGSSVAIKSLHQLQNLIFILTGKELTYTP